MSCPASPPYLPARPDLDQLRHQAKDLLRAAKRGDAEAIARLREVSTNQNLASAQLAVAREYGFASWAKLKTEVQRRAILDDADLTRLHALLAEHGELATDTMQRWGDHPLGPTPLSYVAMLRYDTARNLWRDVPGTGAMARALLAAGAAVDGNPGDTETPLMTAASYGDAEVARALIEAGADLDATAAPNAGGVPGGTALRHAAVFGMTDVVDLLAAAGARVSSLAEAAAAGDITGRLHPDTPLEDRVRGLVMAADHERLDIIDQLLDADTTIDAADPWGRRALCVAAQNGRVASVRRLLDRGADPHQPDATQNRTPLEWCRHHQPPNSPQRTQIEALLSAQHGEGQ